MRATDGAADVILRRLDALHDAIAGAELAPADRVNIEFTYDQVRSSVERALGTRDRLVDRVRATGGRQQATGGIH